MQIVPMARRQMGPRGISSHSYVGVRGFFSRQCWKLKTTDVLWGFFCAEFNCYRSWHFFSIFGKQKLIKEEFSEFHGHRFYSICHKFNPMRSIWFIPWLLGKNVLIRNDKRHISYMHIRRYELVWNYKLKVNQQKKKLNEKK